MKTFLRTYWTFALLYICSDIVVLLVRGHGRLMKPPGRSSIWRLDKYSHLEPPVNYDDNQLFCGGTHQKENPGRNCGVCGDPTYERRPRSNEIGGRFYRGIITEEYQSGDLIRVEVEITAPHLGYMEWRLCTEPKWETQDCFDKHLLKIGDGSGESRIYVGREAGLFWAKLKLPDDVSCEHCVIQWNYRAGNNWGVCPNGEGDLGCGPQETFRGCSDVRIVPRGKQFKNFGKVIFVSKRNHHHKKEEVEGNDI